MTAVTRLGATPRRTASVSRSSPMRPASATNPASRAGAFCSTASPRRRRRVRRPGYGSSTTPPPIVVTGENERSTNRSPPRATKGVSRTRRDEPRCPGAIACVCTARASTSAVPRCTRRRVRDAIGLRAVGRSSTATSMSMVACHPVPVTATCPRASSLLSTPTRASAVRRPGAARSAASPWTSIDRTRASRPSGSSRTDSPTATLPLHVDPVTTVPAPATANTRSMGSRKQSSAGRSTRSPATRPNAARSSSSPSPVTTEVATGASHRTRLAGRRWTTSLRTNSSHSASTRSRLVITGMPRRTPSNSTIARCSSVWGMMPSSAAITSSATSIPVAPASMFRTKPSCPGTSTTLARIVSPSGRGANPRSMVMPLRFSSSQRSVSTPVRAFTRAVFPWSM